jgi:hypothetical protein
MKPLHFLLFSLRVSLHSGRSQRIHTRRVRKAPIPDARSLSMPSRIRIRSTIYAPLKGRGAASLTRQQTGRRTTSAPPVKQWPLTAAHSPSFSRPRQWAESMLTIRGQEGPARAKRAAGRACRKAACRGAMWGRAFRTVHHHHHAGERRAARLAGCAPELEPPPDEADFVGDAVYVRVEPAGVGAGMDQEHHGGAGRRLLPALFQPLSDLAAVGRVEEDRAVPRLPQGILLLRVVARALVVGIAGRGVTRELELGVQPVEEIMRGGPFAAVWCAFRGMEQRVLRAGILKGRHAR